MTDIVFDCGGTKTRVAISHDGRTLAEVVSFKTLADPAKTMEKLAECVKKLTSETEYNIVGGIRGILNEERSGIESDNVLTQWCGFSVTDALSEHLGARDIILENDAALAGLGEAVFGAGQGVEIVAYHTVSTGVGGAKIENGKIDHASIGFEPGHQILDVDRTVLGEEVAPTLENLISGTALENRMHVKPYEIDQTDVVWDELAGYLGQGLLNTIYYWSPDVIVLGGSMIIGDPRIQIQAIRKATVEAIAGRVPCPYITTAQLGDEAGLFGCLARRHQY